MATALAASLFAGCGSTASDTDTESGTQDATQAEATEDPTEKIVDSIYYFSYPVEGMDDMVQFFHFYGDDLGIGSVFYASYAWNQVTFSGTYTVEEADFDYKVGTEKNDDETANITGTAPYTITFYDWDGSELDQCGYDGEYLYNTTTAINTDPATGGGQFRMAYADQEAHDKYDSVAFDGEIGIAYKSFADPTDDSAYVNLFTNGTYEDMAITYVTGTWETDGSDGYTLTPDSSSDNGATIKVTDDGVTYTSDDGTEIAMEEQKSASLFFAFEGPINVAGMDAVMSIKTYDDNTCVLSASLGDMSVDLDQGTYEFADNTFTFTFDTNGEMVSEFGGDTGVQVTVPGDVLAAIGGDGSDAVLSIVLE